MALAGTTVMSRLDRERSASELTQRAVGRPHVLTGCWPEKSVLCHLGLAIEQFTT